jgi:hypothetical protein
LLASIKNSARLELRRRDAPFKNGGMKNGGIYLKWWNYFVWFMAGPPSG